jgi:hypothetical protein
MDSSRRTASASLWMKWMDEPFVAYHSNCETIKSEPQWRLNVTGTMTFKVEC